MSHYHIIFVDGQSNAIGMRANINSIPSYSGDTEIDFACYTYHSGFTPLRGSQTDGETAARRNTDGWETLRPMTAVDTGSGGEGGWAEADGFTGEAWYNPGGNGDYVNSWGYGPEISFARSYHENILPAGQKLGVIKYAIGGSNLSAPAPTEWNPNDSENTTDLFGDSRTYFLARVAELEASGHTWELVAHVFFQGESDTTDDGTYETDLRTLITNRRAQLRGFCPFIICRVLTPSHVRTANTNIAADTRGVGWVDTDSLTRFTDGVHIWEDDQITLGNLVFTEFTSL